MEKVCRISDILEDLSAVTFLGERLSLYGGTALAFIYSEEVQRLSTDLDLNYRQSDEEDWGEARNEIDDKIKNVLYRQGYGESDLAIQAKYPLTRLTVRYPSSAGPVDRFNLEIGYMRRIPVLRKDVFADFRHIGSGESFRVKTPQVEELFANKWCAMLYRKTPRDLFDVYQIASMEFDPTTFRKCAIVDSLMRGRPKLHEIDVSHVVNMIPIDSSLRNLLKQEVDQSLNSQELRREVALFSDSVMDAITEEEQRLIDDFFLEERFDPEKIDEEGIFNERLTEHPSIRWALISPG